MAEPTPEHSPRDVTTPRTTAAGETPHGHAKFVPTIDLPSDGPIQTQGYVPSSATEPTLDADVPVLGDYELFGEIARGGMGVVYKARHRKLNRVVALKVHRAGRLATADEAQRFQVEAEAAAKLDHPHIVPIYEVGELGGQHYFSMALVEGRSLAQRVAEQPLAPREAAGLMREVAQAVAYAHGQGVIHRDLKPGNILMDAAGQPRVTDFGLAKRADADSSLTQAGQVMGTPSYMPPEQAEGKNDQVGPLSDVYSLGATLYCLLTGRPPFQAASVVDTLKQVVEREPAAPHVLNPAVGRDLDTICLKCLQKRPEKRYPSATALADDLQRFLENRPIQARPVGQIEKLFRWCRRNPYVATSLAGIAAVFLAAFVLVSGSYVQAEKARQLAEQREKAERWERYRANLIAVGSAMQLHNVGAAQSSLDAAPEEHRNWEWRYFTHQLDTAQHVIRLGDDIRGIAVSPDVTIAAVQSASGPLRLWNLTTRQEFGSLPNRSAESRSWFSPDGTILAFLIGDTIARWDIRAGRERALLKLPETGINDLQISPNGRRLVTAGSQDRTVRVWDTATGKRLLVLHGHEYPCNQIAFSPDGRRIASAGGEDRTVRLWDAEHGQALAILSGHDAGVMHANFSPQGDRILSVEGYPSNAMRLWDTATGKLQAVLRGHTNVAEHVAFSPDGTCIASGGLDRTIRLWDGHTGLALASREGHRGAITSLGFSPDGKYVISGSHDQTARLWDAAIGAPLGVLHGHTGAIFVDGARYTPEGSTIVTASAPDGTVRLWDARRAEWNGSLRGHESFIYSVAFHPDGERVASAAWDGTVRIWDATTGRQLCVLSYPFPSGTEHKVVASVAFHPAGKLVAAFGRDGVIHVWDLTTEKEAFSFPLPLYQIYYLNDPRVAFSSRGNLLAASGGSDHAVRVWDVERRTEIAALKGHTSWVLDACFSPDDSWLATAGHDRTVRIWTPPLVPPSQGGTTGGWEQGDLLEGHTDQVHAVSVSRDGKWLASGSSDGTVRLWNTTTWKEAAVLKHGTIIYGVAFTPDGTRLASACANNVIRFWDMKTFQLVAELDGHVEYVHQIAFSPDGTRLVSGSGDHTVRIWDSLSVQERMHSKEPEIPQRMAR